MKQSKKDKNEHKHEDKQKSKKEDLVSKKEYEELKDMMQRMHAEFQNYRKRTEDEKSKFIKLANEDLIKKIIPIMDNLELALKHNKKETEFSQGIQLIHAQLLDVLEQEGLQKIPAIGKFDPKLHEVVLIEDTNKEQGTITQELQKGYKLNDKIIRTSKVKISKKQTKEVDKNE